jgi:hypothetical protein
MNRVAAVEASPERKARREASTETGKKPELD